MAKKIIKGDSIFIPFLNGESIPDSQLNPRTYMSRESFVKNYPGHYLGTKDVELAEYAPVEHGQWVNIVDYGDGNCYGFCSACAAEQKAQSGTALKAFHRYCRWCGAKMDLEVEDA